ncbi:MAG: hypothetical protein AB7E95_14600 [Kiritimatiellales bacterium]
MAGLSESATWEPEIYQVETVDLVQGGATGVSNLQPKQLANRTLYLKQKLGTPYVENKTGSTAACSLDHTPVANAAVEVFINRVPAFLGIDFSIAANVITFTQAVTAADEVIVRYRGN